MLWHMSKKMQRAMTARRFAEQMDINYRTALNWLEAGLVPGAERKQSLAGDHWEIPEAALEMKRPKRGPKPGTTKAATKTRKTAASMP
jgi:hypothetical protein